MPSVARVFLLGHIGTVEVREKGTRFSLAVRNGKDTMWIDCYVANTNHKLAKGQLVSVDGRLVVNQGKVRVFVDAYTIHGRRDDNVGHNE